MPVFEITSPDGKKYRVTAPEGATREDALAKVQQQVSSNPSPQSEQPVEAESGNMAGLAMGAQDPVNAAAQMLHNAVPESVRETVNRADNWLYDKTGGLVGSYQPDFNQRLQEQEAGYQANRGEGFDWPRLGGNVGVTTPLAFGLGVPNTLLGALGVGATEGAALGLLQPVTEEGDFGSQKAQQAKEGAVGGLVGGPIGLGISRVIAPKVDPYIRTLMDEGVTPTPGQIMGGIGKTVEEKSRSIPIIGDMVTRAQGRNLDQFNRAIYNRALNPIGKTGDDLPVGREGVFKVKDSLNEAYNEILPKLSFAADDEFANGLNNINQMINATFPEAQARQFETILTENVLKKMTPYQTMNGESLKAVESILGREARGYLKSPDYDKQKLGAALEEVQNLIRQTVQRSSPEYAQRLKDINTGYANYTRLRKAGSMANTEEGITPAQIANAGRTMDSSVGRGQTATGQALMQDLTDAGANRLAQKYPDSGTAGRAMLGGMASYLYDPALLGGLLGASALYTTPMQKLIAASMTKRPGKAGVLGDILNAAATPVGAYTAGLMGE